jgi:hypothetical protein
MHGASILLLCNSPSLAWCVTATTTTDIFHTIMARAALVYLHGCVLVRIDQFGLSCVAHWRICAVRESPLVRTLPFPRPASASARASKLLYCGNKIPIRANLSKSSGELSARHHDGHLGEGWCHCASHRTCWGGFHGEKKVDMFTRIGRVPGVLHD